MQIITKTTQKERVDSKFAEVVQLDYDGVEKIKRTMGIGN